MLKVKFENFVFSPRKIKDVEFDELIPIIVGSLWFRRIDTYLAMPVDLTL